MNTQAESLERTAAQSQLGGKISSDQLASHDLAAELLLCRYRLGRELGRGGMAVVYLAEHLDTGQQLAIKTMSTRLTGTAKQRFTREFSTIASIKHPHCLAVYEYGETQAGPYFAMELFNADPVTQLIGKPLSTILKAIYQLADAIDFVHSRRIIHRDLKPGNMLVRQRGDDYEVRLTDFGLAKFANTSSSMSADVNFMGTLAYCAPEQIMREELDYRADIYAFGVVCYELLAGQHPFADAGRNVQMMIAQHLRENPKPLAQVANNKLPAEIAHHVGLMLEKEVSRRPRSLKPLRQLIAKSLGWSVEDADDSSLDKRPAKLATRFVARHAECQLLEDLSRGCLSPSQAAIDDWQSELPPAGVFITGDAGIGKSSLMRQVARTALVEGAKIYEGRCFEGNLSPFQPIVAVVKQLLVEQSSFRNKVDKEQLDVALATTTFLQAGDGTTQIDELLSNYAPELHRIGPELRNLLPGKAFEQIEMSQESDYIYRAVATFLIELGKLQPTCILIDDLQWSDQATRALLRHVCAALDDNRLAAPRGKIAACRLFLCVTSRAGNEYASVDRYIENAANSRRIDLDPFHADSLRELIAATVGTDVSSIDEGLSKVVLEQCLGNPFYVTSTLKEWLAQGRLQCNGTRWELITHDGDDSNVSLSVREGLLKRVKSLDKVPLQVASLAAVIGKVVDVNLLTETFEEIDEFEILDALDELFARHVLVESTQVRQVEFTHDLIREVILDQLSQSRLRALHRNVGRTLETYRAAGQHVLATKLAEHLSASGDHQRAFDYLLCAGIEALNAFAHADAVLILIQAEKLVEAAEGTSRFQLYRNLALAYAAGEHPELAEPYFIKAMDEAACDEDYALAVCGYGTLAVRQNRIDFTLELVEKGLTRLEYRIRSGRIGWFCDVLAGNTCILFLNQFMNDLVLGTSDTSRQRLIYDLIHLRSIAAINLDVLEYTRTSCLVFKEAHRTGDPRYRAYGYAKITMNLAFIGQLAAAKRLLAIAQNFAAQIDDQELNAYCHALAGCNYLVAGQIKESKQIFEQSINTYQRLGESFFRLLAVHINRHVFEQTGEAEKELGMAREELRMANLTQDPEKLSWANYGIASALVKMGDWDQAEHHSLKARQLMASATAIYAAGIEGSTRGFVLIQSSRYEEALEVLEQTRAWIAKSLTWCDFTSRVYPLALEAALGAQWHEPLDRNSSREKIKRIHKLSWHAFWAGKIFKNIPPHCLRVRARAAAALGQRKRAVRLLAAAIKASEYHEAYFERARALLDRALLNPQTASQDRQQALAILERLQCVLPEAESQTHFGPDRSHWPLWFNNYASQPQDS